MQNSKHYKKVHAVFIILAMFATFVPERVFATDLQVVTNFEYSAENTGGISKKGADGEAGKPGQDGTAGKSGSDGVTVNGKSEASVHIESTMNKVNVSNMYPDKAVGHDSSFTFATHTATEVQTNSLSTNINHSTESIFSTLQSTLFSFQLMLVKYVNLLF